MCFICWPHPTPAVCDVFLWLPWCPSGDVSSDSLVGPLGLLFRFLLGSALSRCSGILLVSISVCLPSVFSPLWASDLSGSHHQLRLSYLLAFGELWSSCSPSILSFRAHVGTDCLESVTEQCDLHRKVSINRCINSTY